MKRLLLLLVTMFPVYAKQAYYQDLVADACADAPRKESRKEPKREPRREWVLESESKRKDVGRSYYESLVQKAEKRHWAIPLRFYFSHADTGYNCEGCKTDLAGSIFGQNPISISDVYLFSKLSIGNQVRINNCNALAPNRGAIPIPGPGAGASAVPFGGFSSDLYTTLLAPVQIQFDAEQQEFIFVPSFIFHYDLGKREKWGISGGVNVPVVSVTHILTFGVSGSQLFESVYLPDTTQAANTLNQFYANFIDVTDFVLREVLGQKCICYEPIQRKTGFGDISLFASLEYRAGALLELGVALVAPTAADNKNNLLWEPALGVGTFQVNPYIQILASTSVPYINPFIRVAGEFSKRKTSTDIRAPRFVTNPVRQQVQYVQGLDHPAFFDQYYVDPFSETDSTVALIAKKACLTQTFGHRVIFGLGNYSYSVFNEDFRFGIYYDYMHKSRDSFEPGDCDCCCGPNPSVDLCLTCTQIDSCTLEQCSDQQSHIISASLTYKFKNLFELGIGGEFVVHGKNVPSTKTGYCNLVIVF